MRKRYDMRQRSISFHGSTTATGILSDIDEPHAPSRTGVQRSGSRSRSPTEKRMRLCVLDTPTSTASVHVPALTSDASPSASAGISPHDAAVPPIASRVHVRIQPQFQAAAASDTEGHAHVMIIPIGPNVHTARVFDLADSSVDVRAATLPDHDHEPLDVPDVKEIKTSNQSQDSDDSPHLSRSRSASFASGFMEDWDTSRRPRARKFLSVSVVLCISSVLFLLFAIPAGPNDGPLHLRVVLSLSLIGVCASAWVVMHLPIKFSALSWQRALCSLLVGFYGACFALFTQAVPLPAVMSTVTAAGCAAAAGPFGLRFRYVLFSSAVGLLLSALAAACVGNCPGFNERTGPWEARISLFSCTAAVAAALYSTYGEEHEAIAGFRQNRIAKGNIAKLRHESESTMKEVQAFREMASALHVGQRMSTFLEIMSSVLERIMAAGLAQESADTIGGIRMLLRDPRYLGAGAASGLGEDSDILEAIGDNEHQYALYGAGTRMGALNGSASDTGPIASPGSSEPASGAVSNVDPSTRRWLRSMLRPANERSTPRHRPSIASLHSVSFSSAGSRSRGEGVASSSSLGSTATPRQLQGLGLARRNSRRELELQVATPCTESASDPDRIDKGLAAFYTPILSYPVLEEVSSELSALLELASSGAWADFDVFRVDELSQGRPLQAVGHFLFTSARVQEYLGVSGPRVSAFLAAAETSYRTTPYHNRTHAADVLQALHYLIFHGGLRAYVQPLDVLAALVAAVVHDLDHTGRTNAFEVATESELALLYNDQSVLEHHSLTQAFSILRVTECNFIEYLSKDQRAEFRRTVVALVLATDMSKHVETVSAFKMKLVGESVAAVDGPGAYSTVSPEAPSCPRITLPPEDRRLFLSMALKVADVSNVGRPYRLHLRWARQVMEEFARQGDEEKRLRLPLSPLCDRETALLPRAQEGFLTFLAIPLFSAWVKRFPGASPLLEHAEEHRTSWSQIVSSSKLAPAPDPGPAGPVAKRAALNADPDPDL